MIKRCDKCGWTGEAAARERRCKQIDRSTGSFRTRTYCWGQLRAAPSTTKRKPKHQSATVRPQDLAAKKLDQARKRIAHWTTVIAKATRSLAEWERKARHYSRRASMTDAEVQAERDRAKAAAAKARLRKQPRRGIVIGPKSLS